MNQNYNESRRCTVPCHQHKWRNIKTQSIGQASESVWPSPPGLSCDIAKRSNLLRIVELLSSMGCTYPRESRSVMAKVGTVTPRRNNHTNTHCTTSATSSLIRATCLRSSDVLGPTPRRWNHTNPCCSKSKISQKKPYHPKVTNRLTWAQGPRLVQQYRHPPLDSRKWSELTVHRQPRAEDKTRPTDSVETREL